jgi:hypothetical protein
MKNQTRKIIDKYIAIKGYERGLKELSEKTGIKYLRLQEHIKSPWLFRTFELKAIAEELDMSDEDLVLLIRGE